MELWIRSQDRMNLVQIKQISLNYENNKQVIANYEPEQYENSSCYYELLGTYKTKERALEVLDKIQNKINAIANMDDINFINVVYEMPKE